MYLDHLFITIAFSFLILAKATIAAPWAGPDRASITNSLEERIVISPSSQPSGTASAMLNAGGYWSEIQVGAAQMEFNLLYDTGSPRLLLCGVAGPKNPKNIYPLTTTQKALGKPFSISYADGTTDSGVEVVDTVTIGGIAIQMTLSVSTICQMGNSMDGILGARLDGDLPNFSQAVAHVLRLPTFAMSMSMNPSMMVFGDSPNTLNYKYEIKTLKPNKYWSVGDVIFSVGSTRAKGILQFDTGTSYTCLDSSIVDAYHAQIEGAVKNKDGTYNISCFASKNPDLTFTDPNNPGYNHIIPGSAFIGNPASGGLCSSMLVPTKKKGHWYPGWAFWTTHYTWFETNSMTLQFAQDATELVSLAAVTHKELAIKEHGLPPPSIMNE